MPQTLRIRKSSAACCKKAFEQFGGFTLANTCVNFWAMIDAGAGEDARAVFDPATFGIAGTVIKPCDSRLRDGGGTHGAGFKRHPKIAVDEPLTAQFCTCLANRDDFGVRGWIMPHPHRIARNRNQFFTLHNDCANGYFAQTRGFTRMIKRDTHWLWQ